MPVRLLNSSVLKWPDQRLVLEALQHWAETAAQSRSDVMRIGYFGSYARGDWGVGSDLDLVIIVESSAQPFERRSIEWDAVELPVPADVLVYTEEEWRSLSQRAGLWQEVVWVYVREAERSSA